MRNKKWLTFFVVIMIVLSLCTLAACNKDESPVSPDSSETPETPAEPENPDSGDTTVTVTETVTVDGVVYTPTDGGTAYTAAAENKQISGEVVIQSPTEGVPVVAITNRGFFMCRSLTSVTIPDSVTTIGESAFAWSSLLYSIKYEGTMEQWNAINIGEEAFSVVGAKVVVCTDGEVTV